jgi:putative salt-induced outer membrane protein
MRFTYLFCPLVAFAATPAHAALPEPVRAMIDAAIATGDADTVSAVIGVARTTNPDDTAELDAMLDAYLNAQAMLAAAEEQAEEMAIREAGLLDNWGGEGQIGAFQSSGNTDSMGLTAQVALEREGINWKHNFRFAADYQRNDGTTDREQFSAAYEPHYQVSERLFLYGLAQFERDRFQGFSSRYALSAGLGYHVVDNDRVRLAVKAGPAWRTTDFVNELSESSIAALAGLDFDWRISDRIKITQDTNAVAEAGGNAVAIIDSKNTSINLVTGIEGKINDRLTTRLSYTVEYDSNPPAGSVSTDTLTRFTFVYGF